WARGLAHKLGIDGSAEEVTALGADLFEMLEAQQVDHTGFFRALAEGRAADLLEDAPAAARWMRRREALDAATPERMAAANPPFAPRAGLEHLEGPGEGGEHFLTFCGT